MATTIGGKTSAIIVANIGRYLSSKMNHKVLIVDADMRSPVMHRLFKKPGDKGLATILEEQKQLKEVIHQITSHLAFLPAGKTSLDPIMLLDSDRMTQLVKMAKEEYDIVLLNGANINLYNDAYVIASYIGGVSLLIEEGYTRRQMAREIIQRLLQRKIGFLGIILNNRTLPIPGFIYSRI